MTVPKRGCADLLSDMLKFGAAIYFLIQVGLFILGVAARTPVEISTLISAVVIAVILFSLGVLLDIALNIERAIYELLAALKRPHKE